MFIGMQKYPVSYKVKWTIFGLQTKITRHSKKQRYVTFIEEKNQSVETYFKQTQTLELVEEDIKNNYNCIMYFLAPPSICL